MVFVRSRGIEVCPKPQRRAAGRARSCGNGIRRPASRRPSRPHRHTAFPAQRRAPPYTASRRRKKQSMSSSEASAAAAAGSGRQRAVCFGGAVENAHALGMPRPGPAYAHRRVVLPGKKIGRGERDCRFRRRHRLGGRFGRRLRCGRERGGGRRFYRRRFGCGRLRHGGGTARKKQHSERRARRQRFIFTVPLCRAEW